MVSRADCPVIPAQLELTKKGRTHPGLNRGPFGLQPNALPLSYESSADRSWFACGFFYGTLTEAPKPACCFTSGNHYTKTASAEGPPVLFSSSCSWSLSFTDTSNVYVLNREWRKAPNHRATLSFSIATRVRPAPKQQGSLPSVLPLSEGVGHHVCDPRLVHS
ncbi:unnamed protein product [Trypanosoma congolense IL3000]|uniref:WGS project CAEQ00000000 data, annotated contig 505 n=1 Tax=Trypanosoma congolense (strain IL3000) TaxID=1068625 RepID=F9WGI4_TRYCI|nr:unnamed protein product [Trypanosoma congolense IL3000]